MSGEFELLEKEEEMRKLGATLAALAISGTMMLNGHAPAPAQENATPIVADPAECVTAPRSTEEIAAIWDGTLYTPDPEIAAGVLPAGTPASDEIVTAVSATLRQFFACSNANNFAAELALMTDQGTLFFAPNEQVTVDKLNAFFDALLATPPAASEYEGYGALTDVTMLGDGRVGALSPADSSEDHAVYVIFANEDGVWLIDQITEITGPATPAATPST